MPGRTLQRTLVTVAVTALGWAVVVPPAAAAGGYEAAELQCRFADPQINESSGVAAASWAEGVIWTHNDSGDRPRFFGVDTRTCATLGVYDVTGARAVDWEDMTAGRGTLYFGDIGDNPSARGSVTIYDVPEPVRGAPSGPVRPSSTRVLTYPDGAHDAESLFVDPTTGRLVIVTKTATGGSAAYRAPPEGSGVMEKVADVIVPGPTTGGDARPDRLVIRGYLAAYEWDVRPGDTLATVLGRPPVPVALPFTPQGEAIAYTSDGSGLWTTSEREGGPVHLLKRAPEPEPGPGLPEVPAPAEGPEVPVLALAIVAAGLVVVGALVWRRRRSGPST